MWLCLFKFYTSAFKHIGCTLPRLEGAEVRSKSPGLLGRASTWLALADPSFWICTRMVGKCQEEIKSPAHQQTHRLIWARVGNKFRIRNYDQKYYSKIQKLRFRWFRNNDSAIFLQNHFPKLGFKHNVSAQADIHKTNSDTKLFLGWEGGEEWHYWHFYILYIYIYIQSLLGLSDSLPEERKGWRARTIGIYESYNRVGKIYSSWLCHSLFFFEKFGLVSDQGVARIPNHTFRIRPWPGEGEGHLPSCQCCSGHARTTHSSREHEENNVFPKFRYDRWSFWYTPNLDIRHDFVKKIKRVQTNH